MANMRNIKNAQANVNEVVENAFVPDMTDRNKKLTQSQKLHNEAGDPIRPVVSRSGIKIAIAKGHAGVPKNGLHKVKIVDIREMKGKYGKGDYDLITLRDLSNNVEWKTTVSYTAYNDTFNSINYYNQGMLDGTVDDEDENAVDKLLNLLKIKPFMVWTMAKDEKPDQVLTYFNNEKYQRYCMAVAYKRTADDGKCPF